MKSAKSKNTSDLQLEKRSPMQSPTGPSVSGGSQKGSRYPITSMLSNMMSGKVAPSRPKAFSDDSYDSSSSMEEKSGKFLTANPVDDPRARKTFTEDKTTLLAGFKEPSAWERTKKLSIEEMKGSKPGKKKSKRHSSLDAKTARFYAKRQQTGWTEGRQLGASSSDDESGLRLKREASPRRKRASKENSSLSSKTPSRDPSVAPSPRLLRPNRLDLPPSSNGVAKTNMKAINLDVPKIQISAEETLSVVPKYQSAPASTSRLTKAPSIEDWINSRSLSGSDKTKGISSSNLSSISARELLFPVSPPQSSATNLPWNHSKSRRSLPVGIDESILGVSPVTSHDVKNKRQLFETVSETLEPSSPNRYRSVANLSQKAESAESPHSSRKRLLVVHEHGKIGLAVNSVSSDKILNSQTQIAPKTDFSKTTKMFNEGSESEQTRAPSRPGRSTIMENPYTQVEPPKFTTPKKTNEPVQKWNSDWQLHQSSSGVGSYRPSSISSFDPNRLRVPSRLAPLKEIKHLELERALEELDEFYESLSTKSEDVTLKSSNSNNRSDSGLSSIPQKEDHIYAEPTQTSSNRLEYTRDWVHYDGSNQLQDGRKVASMMALNQPHNQNLSPYRRLEQTSGSSKSVTNWNSSVDVRKDDYARRKPECKQPPKKTSELPNPSYLLMSVAYTPTVFTGPDLEFQKYPGTNRPQPHQEFEDLGFRKMIHSQNTPSFKVTTDLSKQLPSARNDYATPEVKDPVIKFDPAKKRPKEPDTVRDDVAFRQLRSEKNTAVAQRPQNLSMKDEKPAGPKTRWISNSIRNLAKQFESPKPEPVKSPIPKKSAASDNVMAAMQINGKKFSLLPSQLEPKQKSTRVQKNVSPKISPMNDQQMDDLLLSLRAVPGPQNSKRVSPGFNGHLERTPKSSNFDKITRFAVIV